MSISAVISMFLEYYFVQYDHYTNVPDFSALILTKTQMPNSPRFVIFQMTPSQFVNASELQKNNNPIS